MAKSNSLCRECGRPFAAKSKNHRICPLCTKEKDDMGEAAEYIQRVVIARNRSKK